MWPVKRPARLTKYNKQAWQTPAKGQALTYLKLGDCDWRFFFTGEQFSDEKAQLFN